MTANVLQRIRRAKFPLSKADLAEATGLSLSAISVHVDRLLEEKIIEISRIGVSSGGRKPRQYALNKHIGLILSIELGTAFVRLAFTNFNCEIICVTTCEIQIGDGPIPILTHILKLVDQMILENNFDRTSVKGIGFGIPGPVDFSKGVPISPPLMPGWDSYPIREFWSKYFDCPCFVDNDVNIMALGEHAKGLQFAYSNIIYVNVDSGIGSGIIYNGVLYRGSTGSAGDIGHYDIGTDVVCWCGNRGCLEASAGGKAILSKGKELARSHNSHFLLQRLGSRSELTLDDIGTGVLQLDPVSVELIRESGNLIGRVIASIVNFANPDLIIIGGKVAEFGDIFLAAIRQSVYQRSLPLATRNLIINKSSLGEMASLIGGAFMAIDQLIIQSTEDELKGIF
ncbi:ROK family transcriptional regulator [Paenibacillus sp. HWE-109]|uniref:ROK family transcriptional regulator n=1 Tax=Paenibacillus sp. HWE-109 TaxID=1306526 RepID=UPI001EDF34BF|nr:ROK family transcriptional regulator [Paenibacillus sp. HWE-109]UKS28269.1 ROK family transcriptional regulator [Paenibacillus sp. HWE-109]